MKRFASGYYVTQFSLLILLFCVPRSAHPQTDDPGFEKLQVAVDKAHSRGERNAETEALNKLAKAHSDAGNSAKALDFYNQALTLERERGDRLGEATTLTGLGEVYSATSEPKKALDFYSQSIAIERSIGDRHGEGITLTDMGEVYENTGDTKKAMELYNQALVIQHEIHDRNGEATTLTDIGGDYGDLSQPQKALEILNQVLPIWRELGDRRGEAVTLNSLGFACSNLGQQQKALDYFQQALPVEHAVGDRIHEAMTLSNIGTIYSFTGQPTQALDAFQKALTLGKEVKDRSGQATTLNNIGAVYLGIGQSDPALEAFRQAQAIQYEVGDRNGEAITLINFGEVYDKLGEPQRALTYLHQALPILREVGDRQHEATVYNDIGYLYNNLGQLPKALDAYTQSLAIWQAIKNIQGEANTLNNIGTLYMDLREPQKALDTFNQALPLRRQSQDAGGEADTLGNIATSYVDLGQPEKALSFYKEGLILSRSSEIRPSEASLLMHLASVDTPNALAELLSAQQIAKSVKNPDLEGLINTALMSYWSTRNPSAAIFFGRSAVNNFQQIRGNLRGLDKDVQISFAQFKTPVYRQLAELLIQQGKLREAEDVLDLLKEQELKDVVRGAGPAEESALLPLSEVDRAVLSALVNQERNATDLVALTEARNATRANSDGTSSAKSTDQQITAQRAALQYFFDAAFVPSIQTPAEVSSALTRERKGAKSLRTALRALPVGTVAIYSLVTEKHTFLIVTTPTSVRLHEVNLTGQVLRSRLLDLRRELVDPSSTPQPDLKAFYMAFIAPILPDLQATHAHTLLWSLDGVLRNLPLNALYDGHQYFVEQYANVIITPASRQYLLDVSKPERWSVLAFGLAKSYLGASPLEGVDSELKSIVRDPLVPASVGVASGRLLEDDAFTFAALQQLSPKFPVVHIASHFLFRPGGGDQSFLLLAGEMTGGNGYKMTLAEMRNKLNFTGVRLLTLSACSTASSGEMPNGGEMDSLGMVAQKNGAEAVISTLWNVNDASTSLLMSRFYKRWLSGKPINKIEALRREQIAMIYGSSRERQAAKAHEARQHLYAHPYYWAPFVLIGNFR